MAAQRKINFEQISAIYAVLSNFRRLEVVSILKNGERSVDEMSKIIKIRKANLSQHLSLLRLNRFVKIKRVGQKIFYRLADPVLAKAIACGEEISHKIGTLP